MAKLPPRVAANDIAMISLQRNLPLMSGESNTTTSISLHDFGQSDIVSVDGRRER